jgi:hypothetical protein
VTASAAGTSPKWLNANACPYRNAFGFHIRARHAGAQRLEPAPHGGYCNSAAPLRTPKRLVRSMRAAPIDWVLILDSTPDGHSRPMRDAATVLAVVCW